MGNVMAYSGLVTKVRAMQAKLLTDQDFENIAALHSVPEAVEYLKGKPAYADALNRMDDTLYHRGNVEKVLAQSLYADYTRLYRFAGMKQKQFMRGFWKRYEIDLINYCFRIVFNHYDVPFDLNYKKEYFDRYSKISIDKLVTSGNIEELVENLKGTEYYEPLVKLKDTSEATLYDYETVLEQYYFKNAWTRQRKALDKKEKEIYTRDCGMKIDLLNLNWIYRAKKYYHMLPPDIYLMTIPIHYRIKVDEFKALVEAPTVDQFIQLLANTYYENRFHAMQRSEGMEQFYKACIHGMYLSDRRRNPYSLATVNTYLFLKEEEINRLTTALECIRYGLTPRETLGYIGGAKK